MSKAGEILFGLIMALTFTCSVSIANARTTEVKQLLIAAISCNLAWGVVDAIMFIVSICVKRSRNKLLFNSIRESNNDQSSRDLIEEQMPPVFSQLLSNQEYENLRSRVMKLPEETGRVKITMRDVKRAFGLFFFVFISTFPVVIPFVVFKDAKLALRISNLIAIVMMFLCGWYVAVYAGMNKWRMSIGMVMLGALLVAITVVLGG